MDEFESTILSLVEEREKERGKLQRRIGSAQDQLDTVQLELDGLEAALRLYREQSGIVAAPESAINEELRKRFRDMNHKEVLIAIALDHGGRLVGKEVFPIMISAALYPNERDASNSFYRTTSRFPETFHKVRRGVYEVRAPDVPAEVPSDDQIASQWAGGSVPASIGQRTANTTQ